MAESTATDRVKNDRGIISTSALTTEVVLNHYLIRDDNPSTLDLIGFEDVVNVVEEIVLRPDLDPVTIGINAPWGSGKTTLLRLLESKLNERDNVLCIFVSPWEYDNKTDPTIALIDEVLSRLDEELMHRDEQTTPVLSILQKLHYRVRMAKVIKLAASTALNITLPGTGALLNLFGDLKGNKETADPSLQGFRDQFALLMADDNLIALERVVILVDDLDRSLPDTVVETLEAIKLFLSVSRMAFVIAADEDNVTNAISRRLATTGQPTTARQYLEKIVQIPVRVPVLTKIQTEEYLGLLMVDDLGDAPLEAVRISRPSEPGQLIERLAKTVPDERLPLLELAEQFAPLLHQQSAGNPRRLKRFLNAYWLRVSIASRRDINLNPLVMAKLMLAELHYPELFGLMLSWLMAGNVPEKIAEIETGQSSYGTAVHDWGVLQPPLSELDLSEYLQLAASLRGETVEVAMVPEALRYLATELALSSDTKRRTAINKAKDLESDQRVVIVGYLAKSLRQQRTPDAQKAIADSVSGLCVGTSETNTAVEELRRIPHGMVTAPMPLALLAGTQSEQMVVLVKSWCESPEVSDLARNAAAEALKEH